MSKHYDALVVGGGLSATIAAALLAKRGMRGLLVDQGELSVSDADALFDLIPSDDGSLAMSIVHSELSVREDLRIKARRLEPLLQVVFWDARLDLPSDADRMKREVLKRLGAGDELLSTLLASLETASDSAGDLLAEAGEIPPHGFFAKRSFASAVRKHPELTQSVHDSHLFPLDESEVSELLLSPLPFLTHLDCRTADHATVARFARVLARFLKGLARFEDGRSLRNLFLDVASRKGFVVERAAVDAIQIDGKKLEATLTGRRDSITADYLIDASSDLSGIDALTPKKKDLAVLMQSAKPKGWLHAYAIDADSDVLPPGLATHVLLLNGRKDKTRFDASDPEDEDRPIWMTVAKKDGGRSRLTAIHPMTTARAHSQKVEELERMIHRRMARLIPFLDRGHPEPARVGIDHPLFQPDLDPKAGFTGVPFRTGLKNVLLAGPAVLPGLGVEGAYLAALQAADAVDMQANGTKRPRTLAARA